jgi:hypothetical protein
MREMLYGGDLGEVSMYYGQYCERIVGTKGREGFSGIHEGIDFTYVPGAQLYTIMDGEVTRAGDKNGTVAVYNEDYDMPFGFTEAIVGETLYDDVNEAIESLIDGDHLTLKADVEDAVIINKSVVIDSNKYDADGVATGEFYNIKIRSTLGYVITLENGIYTVTKSDKNANVIFDPDCGIENCTCYGAGIGHKQTYSVIVPVGVVPEYLADIAVINNEGVVADFLGWSYTKGGEVEDITAVTEAQAEAGDLYIYPVYKVTAYDFSVSDKNGNYKFYKADEFNAAITEAFTAAAAGCHGYGQNHYQHNQQ